MARAGDVKSVAPFVTEVNQDPSEMVRAAMTFALYKKGHPNYLGRLIDFMDSDRLMPQIYGYLVELGPSIVAPAVVRLKEPTTTSGAISSRFSEWSGISRRRSS